MPFYSDARVDLCRPREYLPCLARPQRVVLKNMLDPAFQQPKATARRRVVLVVAVVTLLTCFALLAGVLLGPFGSCPVPPSSTVSSVKKVNVTLYGESLCPDCRHMVLEVIAPMLEKGLGDVMSLRYVAYGNVRSGKADGEGSQGIKCQHGAQECLMNKYINCAQVDGVGNSDAAVWFPYVTCLADDLAPLRSPGEYGNRARECATQSGLSASRLKKCAEGSQGEALERQAGEETDGLVPGHSFVPWMLVNGAAVGSDYDNLDRFVCVGSGSGGAMPAACSELRSSLMHQ